MTWVLGVLMACSVIPVMVAGFGGHWLLPLVLTLILVKAWLVVDWFMELRHAPRLWRWLVQAWAPLVVLGVVATGLF